MRIALRYDDLGGDRPTEVEKGIIHLVRECGIALTVSVIPCVDSRKVLGAECVRLLREMCGNMLFELAQHGWSHEPLGLWHGLPSEFYGLPSREQFRRMSQGKALIEAAVGHRVTTFVPPWNSYDSATIACLRRLGFQAMSGDWGNPGWDSAAPLSVPMTCHLRNLRAAIDKSRRAEQQDALVVAVFHGYDFLEIDAKRGWLDLPQFRALLEWISVQPDIRTVTIKQVAELNQELDGRHQQRVCQWIWLEGLLPPVARSSLFRAANFPGARKVRRLIVSATLRLVQVNLLLAFIGAGLAFVVMRVLARYHPSTPLARWVVPAVCTMAFGYGLRDCRLHTRRLSSLALAVGGLVVWLASVLGA